ncbi:hypothetical protein BDZ91DRAFT_800148 [Kalaharituber pfeilii]|nr:hypothetical protein BDZ91DRAFT_800148 [Kalaharituber pfeilii]
MSRPSDIHSEPTIATEARNLPRPTTPPPVVGTSAVPLRHPFTTPVRLGHSSIERGIGSLTHNSIYEYLRHELDGLIHVNCLPMGDFQEKFVLAPAGTMERAVFDSMVRSAMKVVTAPGWAESPGAAVHDGPSHDWLLRTVENAQNAAIMWLDAQETKATGVAGKKQENLNINPQLIEDLPERMKTSSFTGNDNPRTELEPRLTAIRNLKCRLHNNRWRSCRHLKMRSPLAQEHVAARRSCDFVLTSTPNDPSSWASVIVVGEHKSSKALGALPSIAVQLGEYVSAALVTQAPFR